MKKDETVEILSIEGRDVRLTHPEKLYFSRHVKLTKRDLVLYYLSVAPGALQLLLTNEQATLLGWDVHSE